MRQLQQIAEFLGCRIQKEAAVTHFCQDSRLAEAGSLFFALSGNTVDGHDFLQMAAEKGAIAAVVAKSYMGPNFGLDLLFVPDVLRALQLLASKVQEGRAQKVIGVTGSVGKTTVKEFIATLLGKKFRVAKTPGNANSQVSVPLSVLNAAGDEEVFVAEMGMSQPGEIARLVKILPPDIAVITKIALAHAQSFPDGLEGIAKAKAEILSHPKTRLALINEQAWHFAQVRNAASMPHLTYAVGGSALQCNYSLGKEGEYCYLLEKGIPSPKFRLPFQADHLAENLTGALAVVRQLGMTWEEILPYVDGMTPYHRRFEQVVRDGVLFIDDSYNANPTSMRAALENLPTPKGNGRRIAVLGSMMELGEHSEVSHYEIGRLALSTVDHLICFGQECLPMVELFQRAGRPIDFFLEFSELKQRVFEVVGEEDVVLLKGSNSKKLWQILEK
ncbi:MAG: UDP-N-acetylmuramoyl-tripeptide--D-alanyl-D-alanine ligase [Verrucomicrobia bacterium]|nr:UDP-N-acetylmuramoyl-tripeptide--D-alanyl-D-alanine ligase [Verrucomicrobiota bacterium]